ncbi:hypothetical protein J2Z53_000505 [Clostridium moniliforme]|uniref:Uncharacterized protein n=1 Tax=Clostridium moniliforme TaxID=39489 RepID=A0ABS4EY52_9CLOT|nr:hypothetical protein [Clostridium moniliforme]
MGDKGVGKSVLYTRITQLVWIFIGGLMLFLIYKTMNELI